MKNIDDLSQYSLSKRGTYFQFQVKEGLGLVVRQRFDDKWNLGDNDSINITQKEKDKTFDYSSNPMDPKIENYKKTKTTTEEKEVEIKQVTFYLQNIPANGGEPAQLFVNKTLILTLQNSTPLNQRQRFIYDLPDNTIKSIDVKFNIRAEGYDINQNFELSKGSFIQFVIIDDQMRVAQTIDGKFPEVPFQTSSKRKEKDNQTETQSNNNSNNNNNNSGEVDVVIYCVGCDATSVKKFIVKINENVIQKYDKPIPKDQILALKSSVKKTTTNSDHIIKFSALLPAKGFFEPIEQEFNLTKHGRFIKLEVSDLEKGTNVDFAQQHEDFKFGSKPEFKQSQKEDISNIIKTKIIEESPKKTTSSSSNTTTTSSTTTKTGSNNKTSANKELDEVEKLGELLKKGIINEQEFNIKKKKILGL